jgi:hypothetical protein
MRTPVRASADLAALLLRGWRRAGNMSSSPQRLSVERAAALDVGKDEVVASHSRP